MRDRPGYPQHLPHRRAGQGHRLGESGSVLKGLGDYLEGDMLKKQHPQRRARL